jgi:hypothetical protein
MTYCENTGSLNEMKLLSQYEEAFRVYLEVLDISCAGYPADVPKKGKLFPPLSTVYFAQRSSPSPTRYQIAT